MRSIKCTLVVCKQYHFIISTQIQLIQNKIIAKNDMHIIKLIKQIKIIKIIYYNFNILLPASNQIQLNFYPQRSHNLYLFFLPYYNTLQQQNKYRFNFDDILSLIFFLSLSLFFFFFFFFFFFQQLQRLMLQNCHHQKVPFNPFYFYILSNDTFLQCATRYTNQNINTYTNTQKNLRIITIYHTKSKKGKLLQQNGLKTNKQIQISIYQLIYMHTKCHQKSFLSSKK
eukprot:TRINITY_DN2396_c0_g1_i11.p1 TRINITY_DN2396_c0_g1~~TRINITY_DN2396_c0_g1_i11.p1  ORF type:complete len:227 (+),score=-16.27 TRINITY_DN2396_c0_g1_i11:752-1432(+)